MNTNLLIFILLLLTQSNAFASESWLCTDDSSQLYSEGIVAACGVAEARTEGMARELAFNSARTEFDKVCGEDTPCGEMKFTVEPKRMTCEQIQGGWKCYRLVVFRTFDYLKKGQSTNIIPSQSFGNVEVGNQEAIDKILNAGLTGRPL